MNASDPLIGQVLAERYEVQSLLSTGGMGKIYIAEQQSTGQQVAIKCILDQYAHHPSLVERFRREAMIISKLKSPHTLRLLDQGVLPGGGLFMVCELLEGRPLDEVIDTEGRLSVIRTLNIMQQVLRSLAEAHRHGVIHRDLKPNNLFLTTHDGEEHVTVLDFGIAKWKAESAPLTRAGSPSPGTPEYMPPEQLRGLPCDPPADFYALAVVLFECLTGMLPFQGDLSDLQQQHFSAPPPTFGEFCTAYQLKPVHAPQALETLIHWCLEKDPALRPQSVDELRHEVSPLYHQLLLGRSTAVDMPPETQPLRFEKHPGPVEAEPPVLPPPSGPFTDPAHDTPLSETAPLKDSALEHAHSAAPPATSVSPARPHTVQHGPLRRKHLLVLGATFLLLAGFAGFKLMKHTSRDAVMHIPPSSPRAHASSGTAQATSELAYPKATSNQPSGETGPIDASIQPAQQALAPVNAPEPSVMPLVDAGMASPLEDARQGSARSAPIKRLNGKRAVSSKRRHATSPSKPRPSVGTHTSKALQNEPQPAKINLNLGTVGTLKSSGSSDKSRSKTKPSLIEIKHLGEVKSTSDESP